MAEKVIKREENVYESVGDVPAREEVKVVRQEVSTHSADAASRWAVFKIDQTLWLLLGMLEALLGIRVFLKLIAANPESGFARFIYGLSDLFLLPFFGLTQTPSANGAVLEIPTIIAMVVYALVFSFLVYIVHLVGERP